MATKKPNILYIMADQMAAPLLAFHDKDSPIKTPNLNRLADEGVVFDSAYCNSPLCAPSRFVMVTGQLPSKIGAYDNAADLPADIPTYAHYLRREGYHTALAGKMHFCGPDQLHGYEQRLTSDIYPGDYGWSVNWDEPVSCIPSSSNPRRSLIVCRKSVSIIITTCPLLWTRVLLCGPTSLTLMKKLYINPPSISTTMSDSVVISHSV